MFFKNVPQEENRTHIFNYLEAYIMRRIICRATNKNYNRLFSDHLISNEALSKKALKELIENKSDKINYIPTNEDLEKGFHESKLINKQAAGVQIVSL